MNNTKKATVRISNILLSEKLNIKKEINILDIKYDTWTGNIDLLLGSDCFMKVAEGARPIKIELDDILNK